MQLTEVSKSMEFPFLFSGLSKLFPSSKLFGGYNELDGSFKTHEIDACAGAFMMVRRQAGEKIGWWDEDYFSMEKIWNFVLGLRRLDENIFLCRVFPFSTIKGFGGIKSFKNYNSKS